MWVIGLKTRAEIAFGAYLTWITWCLAKWNSVLELDKRSRNVTWCCRRTSLASAQSSEFFVERTDQMVKPLWANLEGISHFKPFCKPSLLNLSGTICCTGSLVPVNVNCRFNRLTCVKTFLSCRLRPLNDSHRPDCSEFLWVARRSFCVITLLTAHPNLLGTFVAWSIFRMSTSRA